MDQKLIEIRIFNNGTVKSKTKGMVGKSCMKYIQAIEELTGSRTIDSEFTPEYYMNEQKNVDETEMIVQEEEIQYNKEMTNL